MVHMQQQLYEQFRMCTVCRKATKNYTTYMQTRSTRGEKKKWKKRRNNNEIFKNKGKKSREKERE